MKERRGRGRREKKRGEREEEGRRLLTLAIAH